MGGRVDMGDCPLAWDTPARIRTWNTAFGKLGDVRFHHRDRLLHRRFEVGVEPTTAGFDEKTDAISIIRFAVMNRKLWRNGFLSRFLNPECLSRIFIFLVLGDSREAFCGLECTT